MQINCVARTGAGTERAGQAENLTPLGNGVEVFQELVADYD